MSRRRGQSGCVFQRINSTDAVKRKAKDWDPNAPTYGRYWVDTPGGRQQKTVSLGQCRTLTTARQRMREHLESAKVNSKQQFLESTSPAVTFEQQAEFWLNYMQTRTRKPVKPATAAGWQQALDAWLTPHLGTKLLADIGNGTVRELVGKMVAAKLSPKTITNYIQVVKMVVASAVNENGDQIYPRTWNHDFIGVPIIRKDKQRRPTITEAELSAVLSSVKQRYAVLFAVLAGTGLRIGEALGLKPGDLSDDCRLLHVRRSMWRGHEQEPKTPNAVRMVDVPEELAQVLRLHRGSTYLFATRKGRPLSQRNLLRVLHATGKHVGFHAFRRFRTEVLRKARVPEDLLRLWLGHSKETITDFYADGVKNDSAWRRDWTERAGLGFSIVTLVTQNATPTLAVKAA